MDMRTLATLMAAITVLTYGLFANALAGAEQGPAAPLVTHQTGSQQTGPHQTGS